MIKVFLKSRQNISRHWKTAQGLKQLACEGGRNCERRIILKKCPDDDVSPAVDAKQAESRHTNCINGKLDVASLTKAVARAKELSLL